MVFVPYTADSALRKTLQKAYDPLSVAFNRPKVKFVERAGTHIARDVGRPNPWAGELYYTREDCVVCAGRLKNEAEKEEAAMAMDGKAEGPPKPIRNED